MLLTLISLKLNQYIPCLHINILRNLLFLTIFQPFTYPRLNTKKRFSQLLLIINPKNYLIEHFPHSTSSSISYEIILRY